MARGGAERQCVNLSLGLARRGHDVHVALLNQIKLETGSKAPAHTKPLSDELLDGGVKVHCIGKRFKIDPLAFIRLCDVISEIRPDWMLTLFTTDPGVIVYGIPYLKVLAISFLVETGMFCMFGLMTGAGYTNYTMVCALLSAFVVRFSLAWYLSTHTSLGFLGIAWAYPFAPVASCIVCVIFLCSGKWKQSRLKMRQQ